MYYFSSIGNINIIGDTVKIIKNYKKINKKYWRRTHMEKVKEKNNFNINMLTNDWDELCDICSSIAQKTGLTEKDTDKILKDVRKELRGRN